MPPAHPDSRHVGCDRGGASDARIIRARDAQALGEAAAELVASAVQSCVREKGRCRLALSTGQSQFTTLAALARKKLDWRAVHLFHLGEYMDLPVNRARRSTLPWDIGENGHTAFNGPLILTRRTPISW